MIRDPRFCRRRCRGTAAVFERYGINERAGTGVFCFVYVLYIITIRYFIIVSERRENSSKEKKNKIPPRKYNVGGIIAFSIIH